MNRTARLLFQFVLAAAFLAGCAAPTAQDKEAYAYDNEAIPKKDVAALVGFYGRPAMMIDEVDGKKFSASFSKPQPVKIYVLPGKHQIKATYYIGERVLAAPSGSGAAMMVHTDKIDSELTVDAVAGRTHRIVLNPRRGGGEPLFIAIDTGKSNSP